MKTKIIRALLNTKLADKLIDKYLSKRSVIEIANTISKNQVKRGQPLLHINNYILYNKKNQGGNYERKK